LCGIFGIYGYVDKQLITKMSDILAHRGPDDVGFFFDENIALGNRRLSIIDIKGGHQPIHNEDSSMWVTFNGEIYNFQELRQELERRGHKFYTDSDTEVIIHAYEEWQENCTKKFNGMWAFAIWDSVREQLFLSRDMVGIKPLYYFFDGNKFVFASEIKAILLEKSIQKTPNDRVIYEYLAYALHDHTEQTFFNGVMALLPGHNLIVNKKGIRSERYWDMAYISKETESLTRSDDFYAKSFFELLKNSVQLRLISEVPIGTCLSGGLDSSSIVFLINRLLFPNPNLIKVIGEKQKTFSACYEEKRIDEREYIEEVTRHTTAEKNFIFPSSEQLWMDIKKLVYYQDEPFVSVSVFAQWSVMKLASTKVKVVLDGQGGDELLAGYSAYYGVFLMNLLKERKIYSFIKELLLSLDLTLSYFKRYVLFSPRSKRLNESKRLLDENFIHRFDRAAEANDKNGALPRPAYSEGVVFNLPGLAEQLYLDLTKFSLPALLRYEDRNSMAFSVEARVPFLDPRLIGYVFSLPISQRLKNGWTKYILRNAMKGILPEKILKRRSKVGFATPEVKWLRELRKEIREVFASAEFGKRKYFNQKEILRKFDDFCDGKLESHAMIFWRILNLEMWLRIFFDNQTGML